MPGSPSRPARRHRTGAAIAAFTLLSLFALLPGTAVAAAPPIRLELWIGQANACITVFSAADKTITIVWRDSAGALKAQGSGVSDGLWYFCQNDSSLVVEIGDRIKVSDGSYKRTYVVPALTLEIDRVNDVFKGTGPAGRTIRLEIPLGDVGYDHSVRVGQDGHWSFDPHFDVWGGEEALIKWKSPNGDDLYLDGTAAALNVTLSKASFSGRTTANAQFDVSLDGATDGVAHVTAGPNGFFAGEFRDNHGHLVRLAPGDHVSAPGMASDSDWMVPAVQASADKANDVVSGQCGDGTASYPVDVLILHSGHFRGHGSSGTEPDGTFSVDFKDTPPWGGSTNIIANDHITVGCIQPTGDAAQVKFRVP